MEPRSTEPHETVLLVCHDAGGAQVLAHWQTEHTALAVHAIDGPARQIFSRLGCSVSEVPLDLGVQISDWVLTGSSWGSDIEVRAIRLARSLGKFCVTFLDHWVNYGSRFELGGEQVLPDQIWVGDVDAYKFALVEFPGTQVLLRENPYFSHLRRFFQMRARASDSDMKHQGVALWVGENIHGASRSSRLWKRHRGYTEKEALNFFLESLDTLDVGITHLDIRPHPSDTNSSYDNVVATEGIVIRCVANSVPIEEQIMAANLVVGTDSMGLFLGVLAGKRTISAIPAGGLRRSIPCDSIEDLTEIRKAAQSR